MANTAPVTSPRPKGREEDKLDRQFEEFQKMELFADTEFEAANRAAEGDNPLARLGFKTAKPHVSTGVGEGAFSVPAGFDQLSPAARTQVLDAEASSIDNRINLDLKGLVFAAPTMTDPNIWNHEFTHVGMEGIADLGLDEVERRWGKGGVEAVELVKQGYPSSEILAELFDAPASTPLISQSAKYPDMQATKDKGASSGKPIRDRWIAQDPQRAVRIRETLTEIALDLLIDEGVPAPAQAKEGTRPETPEQAFQRRNANPKVQAARGWLGTLLKGRGDNFDR